MYGTIKEAADGCRIEVAAAMHFSKMAITFAKRGAYRMALDAADTSKVAAKGALEARDALRRLGHGFLTPRDWDAFDAVDEAVAASVKACKAAEEAAAKRKHRTEA